jgi:hypothetical protein
MALSKSAITSDVISALESQGFLFNEVSQLEAFVTTVVDKIVDHIQTTGVVNTTVTGTSASGGPVTGTGVGTLS